MVVGNDVERFGGKAVAKVVANDVAKAHVRRVDNGA